MFFFSSLLNSIFVYQKAETVLSILVPNLRTPVTRLRNIGKQGLLKNWPRVTGVFKVISWRRIWHTNFEGGTRSRSSKKLASSVRQGLQGMGCSKLYAEGGIGHTNFELLNRLFDRATDTKLWKSSKNRRGRGRETLYFYSVIYLFTFRATAFFSIVRTDIIFTPNLNPKVCCCGNENAGWILGTSHRR